MPTLDVNDAFDPSFLDQVTVYRITEFIDQHGRVGRQFQNMIAPAVIVAATPDDLQRLPEEEYANKAIRVYSQFRFQGPVAEPASVGQPRTHPDELLWHGSRFVVRALDDYSGYGRGFVMVIAVSVEAIDAAPLPDLTGEFPATQGSA
jgi:hypothetical protein